MPTAALCAAGRARAQSPLSLFPCYSGARRGAAARQAADVPRWLVVGRSGTALRRASRQLGGIVFGRSRHSAGVPRARPAKGAAAAGTALHVHPSLPPVNRTGKFPEYRTRSTVILLDSGAIATRYTHTGVQRHPSSRKTGSAEPGQAGEGFAAGGNRGAEGDGRLGLPCAGVAHVNSHRAGALGPVPTRVGNDVNLCCARIADPRPSSR